MTSSIFFTHIDTSLDLNYYYNTQNQVAGHVNNAIDLCNLHFKIETYKYNSPSPLDHRVQNTTVLTSIMQNVILSFPTFLASMYDNHINMTI